MLYLIGDHVVVCGGGQDDSRDDCFHFNLTTKTWDLKRSVMTDGRKLASSVIHKGEMVVLGGVSVDSVDVYRNGLWIRMDEWSLPSVNYGFCAVSHDKYIYQIGGSGLDKGGVVRLNTETNSYEDVPSLPGGNRLYHECLLTTIKGEVGILVTGSLYSGSRNIVEFFVLANQHWIQLGNLIQHRHNHGLQMIGGKPTVFGGYGADLLDDFEYYDEDTYTWNTIRNMTLSKPKRRFAYVRTSLEINK